MNKLVAAGCAAFALVASASAAMPDGVARHYVARYDLNGVTHYTNQPPPDEATNVKTLFSYIQFANGDTWMASAVSEKDEYFIHTQSLTLEGKIATGWILRSSLPAEGKTRFGPLSTKTRWTVDCKAKRTTTTDSIDYSKEFGLGETVSSWSGQDQWQSVVPGTVGETLAGEICKGPAKDPTPGEN